jgi:hypothetical protein
MKGGNREKVELRVSADYSQQPAVSDQALSAVSLVFRPWSNSSAFGNRVSARRLKEPLFRFSSEVEPR